MITGWRAAALVLSVLASQGLGWAAGLSGQVVDASTGQPLGDATVTADDEAVQTDEAGNFRLNSAASILHLRAPGYARKDVATGEAAAKIALTPLTVKALYLSFYGIGSAALRNGALQLVDDKLVNALVIDVKGDRGLIAFRSAVPLATEAGAQKIITIPDLPALLATLHQRNIYAIARIVVFKDDPLAAARPDLAVKKADGDDFRDREGLRWVDPSNPAVWDYDIAIAVEAAKAGFDEIQFDYMRFPDSREIRFSSPSTEASRTRAIAGFIDAARERLRPYNVYLAVDVFGYTCWNLDDTGIGQRIEEILPRVDYLSPMLYPSGFQYGIPGYTDPLAHVYEIVRHSLDRAWERTHVSRRRLRPWLQAFKDYAFDRRAFDATEIGAQIQAAEDFGANGWMLWNPRNVYSDHGLDRDRLAACW